MVAKKRTTQGRRKIEMKKIVNEGARNVCFSKRRNGIFSKASDLVTLCGAMVAILVKSPAGNPFSFGFPGVNEVVDRFLGGNNPQPRSSSSMTKKLNKQCMDSATKIDFALVKKSKLEARIKELVENNLICQLVEGTEGHGLENLEKVERLLVGFKASVDAIKEELSIGGTSSSSFIPVANPPNLMNQFSYQPNQDYFDGPNQEYFYGNFGYGHRFY